MSALAMAMVLTGAGAAVLDHFQSRQPPVPPPVSVIRPPPPLMIYRPPPPPPPPPPRGTGPQRVDANFSAYFRIDDYPVAAFRADEQGTVSFRLTIGRDGRVSRCMVTATSGSAALDQATCRILRERARYTPARDSRGRRTRGSDSGSVSWRLPVD